MLKQSHMNGRRHHYVHLYDKVRQDLFEEKEPVNKIRTPSITTICLLQIQAYIIQMLANLPPIRAKPINNNLITTSTTLSFLLVYQQKRLNVIWYIKTIIRQCLRWLLLVVLLILDNIARLLNVESEMADISASKENATTPVPINGAVVRRHHHHHQLQDNEELELEDDDDDEDDDVDEEEELDDYTRRRSSTDTTYRDYYLQKNSSFILNNNSNKKIDQCTSSTNLNHNNNSEPASPTSSNKRSSSSVTLPPSPINSPTPNFVLQPRPQGGTATPTARPSSVIISSSVAKAAINNNGESPILASSRVNNNNNNNNRHRTRSLSNNMIDTIINKQQQQQKLRRITGQREITVQNAILPIPTSPKTATTKGKSSGHHHHHHHHNNGNKRLSHSTANSVSSSESSSTTTSRPRMQKTVSLSTAQQYHQQHDKELYFSHNNKMVGDLPQLYDSNSHLTINKKSDLTNGVVQPVHHPHIHNNGSVVTAFAATSPIAHVAVPWK